MNETIVKYQAVIETALNKYQFPTSPDNLYEPLRYFMQLGGKRMRPIITLMAAELFSADYEKATSAAIAVEMFHNFSLIHDDIMDAAPLRRNKETVHQKWNANVAILSGDALLIEAYKQLGNYDPAILAQLFPIFNDTAILVCEGQQSDMDFETSENVSIPAYIEMIRKKTAVLLGCSLQMGAIVGGADEQSAKQCYDFGVNLGISFQLQDDLLDVYADQAVFGKQVGGDIISNKKTFLFLSALQAANDGQKSAFKELLSEKDHKVKVEGIKAIYDELAIKEKTAKEAELYYQKAMINLKEITCPEEKKQPLTNLANFLLNREV